MLNEASRPLRSPPSKPRRKSLRGLDPASVHPFVEDVLGDDLHARRVFSLAHGVLGVLNAASLAILAIGQGLSVAMGLAPKHAVSRSIAC